MGVDHTMEVVHTIKEVMGDIMEVVEVDNMEDTMGEEVDNVEDMVEEVVMEVEEALVEEVVIEVEDTDLKRVY